MLLWIFASLFTGKRKCVSSHDLEKSFYRSSFKVAGTPQLACSSILKGNESLLCLAVKQRYLGTTTLANTPGIA